MAKIKSGFMGERAISIPESVLADFNKSDLGKNLYISDIGFYPKAEFHYRKRDRKEVNQYILIYCIEGEGWYELNNQKTKISANQIFILPKEKLHAYGSKRSNPWTIYWIHFDGLLADLFSNEMDKPMLITAGKDSRIDERFKLFEEIFATLKNGYSKNNLDYSITVLFHFLGSLKYLNTYRGSLNNDIDQKDLTEDAIHYMRENIRKRLTLKEISEYIGVSPSYFSSLFQKKTGFSPLNYLSHLKIQEACHYLDFSHMKVNQISLLIGYEDPFYFSRLFTKVMGHSPTEYRNRKKG
jgi:AraC-like DNA-binding protein